MLNMGLFKTFKINNMNKPNGIFSFDLIHHFDTIYNKLGIDTQVYKPVRITEEGLGHPFVSSFKNAYCS